MPSRRTRSAHTDFSRAFITDPDENPAPDTVEVTSEVTGRGMLRIINEARRTVAIANEGGDQALKKAVEVIRRFHINEEDPVIRNRRRAKGSMRLSRAEVQRLNQAVEQIAGAVEALITDDIPF